jgi:hypothetical protein
MNETLLEISQLPSECATLDEMLPKLHRLLMRLMDASNFYIALYDEQASSLHYPFMPISKTRPHRNRKKCFPGSRTTRSLTAWLMRMGKPLVPAAPAGNLPAGTAATGTGRYRSCGWVCR